MASQTFQGSIKASKAPVEFESQEDELEDVDSAEELELEGPVVSEAPDADGDGQDTDEDQRHKNLRQTESPRFDSDGPLIHINTQKLLIGDKIVVLFQLYY